MTTSHCDDWGALLSACRVTSDPRCIIYRISAVFRYISLIGVRLINRALEAMSQRQIDQDERFQQCPTIHFGEPPRILSDSKHFYLLQISKVNLRMGIVELEPYYA